MENLQKVLDEITYLQKRSSLLDEILTYYNQENMTFDIPEAWKNYNRVPKDRMVKIAESPRHHINDLIKKTIPEDELYFITLKS